MTSPSDIAGLSERLRAALGGIAREECLGDNLAILLASYFEPHIEDETLDECGNWKQGAIDACDKVLDAIHAHYAVALDSLTAENARLTKRLDLLAAGFSVPDGGKYLEDWQARIKQYQSFSARVKELEAGRDKWSAQATKEDDCRKMWQSRALRAEQQRNEAYERAAKEADQAASDFMAGGLLDPSVHIARKVSQHIAAAIRRLAPIR